MYFCTVFDLDNHKQVHFVVETQVIHQLHIMILFAKTSGNKISFHRLQAIGDS